MPSKRLRARPVTPAHQLAHKPILRMGVHRISLSVIRSFVSHAPDALGPNRVRVVAPSVPSVCSVRCAHPAVLLPAP